MIKDILIAQKQELEDRFKEQYVERKVNINKLEGSMIKVIIGPRRAGKSFFALHLLNKKGDFGYINFDDERLIDVKNYDVLLETINTIYKNPKSILFDEIQNLPKWELFVNRIQRRGFNLFITGSNSRLLSKELATHLTGRHFLLNIFPFSFKEYLNVTKMDLTSIQIKERFSNFVVNGGYPEPLIKSIDYKEYISALYNSIIYKDIIKRYKIRFAQGVEDLGHCLLSNVTSEYSYNSLSKMTKVKSVHTIEKYLGYLEESFILFSLKRFSYKVKEQITFNKKIYSTDNGFINAKAFKFIQNFGKLYENIVAIELKKKEIDNKFNFYYWKNQQQEEIDFVIQEGIKIKRLIQVCYDINNIETKQREIRALIKGSKELRCNDLLIITEDYENTEKAEWFGDKATIKYVPLWKWLLSQDTTSSI